MGAAPPCAKLRKKWIDDEFVEKLREKILGSVDIDSSTGCWVWKMSKSRKKYSRDIRIIVEENGKKYRVSIGALRASLFAFRSYGDQDEPFRLIGGGRKWLVYRTCDSNCCVNPDHIEGTTDVKETQWKVTTRIFNNKLVPGQISEIKRRILNGDPILDIAQEYGVAKSTIKSIKNGRRWANVA